MSAPSPARPKIVSVLTALYLFCIPLQWTPNPWNIQLSDLVFVGLAICILFNRRFFSRMPLHRLDLFLGLYLAVSAFSFWRSGNRLESGIPLVKQLYLATVYFLFAVLSENAGDRQKWCRWQARTAVCAALFGVLAAAVYYLFGLFYPSIGMPMPIPAVGKIFRVQGPFYSHEYFGDYLTFSLPLLIGLSIKSESPGRWRIGLAAAAAAAILTVTHSLAGLCAGALFFLWWTPLAKNRAWRIARIALCAATIFLFLAVNGLSIVSIRQCTITSGKNPAVPPAPYVYAFQDKQLGSDQITFDISYNPMSYFLLKKFAVEAFLDKPITGQGLEQYPEVTARAYQQGRIHSTYKRMDAHCTLLGRLAETGILGGISLLLFVAGLLFYGSRLIRRSPMSHWAEAALLAGSAGLLMNSLNVDIMNFRFLWVGFGIIRGSFRSSS